MNENKLDSAKKNFVKYLDNLGLSPKSHKNYRSDLSHFTAWVIAKIRSFGSYVEILSEAIPFLNSEMANEYKKFMLDSNVPVKTVNRRLSTLRHFSKSLLIQNLVDKDFTLELENISTRKKVAPKISPLVNEFKAYLEAEKVSPNTIKNYLSDTRQFLSWLETNKQIYK